MTAQEIERLQVTLTGEGSALKATLDNAAAQAQAAAKQIEAAGKQAGEGFGKSLQGAASGALQALGALGVAGSLTGAFNAFSEMERGQLRLRAVLEGNGRNVEEAISGYGRLADSISSVTLTTRGQVMSMAQQAEVMGLTAQQAERAIQNSVGLAGALGGEAGEHFRMAAALERGNTSLMRRILRLREGTSDTEVMAAAQRMMAAGMRAAEAEASSASGQISKLQRSLKGVSIEVGALVAQAVMPLVQGLTRLVEWFKGLDSRIRGAVVGVVVLSAATLAFGPVVSTLTALLGGLRAAMVAVRVASTFMLGHWGLIIAAAAAVVLVFIENMGGLQNAWEQIRKTIASFAKWATPIIMAVWGAASAAVKALLPVVLSVWGAIRRSAEALGGFLSGVWQSIFGGVDWEHLKDEIVNSFITAEFAIKNWEQVVEYLGTRAAQVMLGFALDVAHFFTDTIPVAVGQFVTYWSDAWTNAVNLAGTLVSNLASNVVGVITNLPGLISGQTNWSDVWRPLTEGFESVMSQMPEFAARARTDVERELERMGDAQILALGTDLAEFIRQRRAEMDRMMQGDQPPKPPPGQAKPGQPVGRFDAAAAFSAEAATRIAEFQARAAEPARAAATPEGLMRQLGLLGSQFFGNMNQQARATSDLNNNLSTTGWNNFGTLAENFWTEVGRVGSGIWTWIQETAGRAWDWIKETAGGVWDWIKETAGGAWEWIQEAATKFWDGLLDTAKGVWTTITDGAAKFWSDIKAIAEGVWNGIRRTVEDVFRVVSNPAQAGRDLVSTVTSTITGNGNRDLLGTMTNYLGQIARNQGIQIPGLNLE